LLHWSFLFGFDTVVISGADKSFKFFGILLMHFHGTVVMGMALWELLLGQYLEGFPLIR
jgi:hypothetical protein